MLEKQIILWLEFSDSLGRQESRRCAAQQSVRHSTADAPVYRGDRGIQGPFLTETFLAILAPDLISFAFTGRPITSAGNMTANA